MSRAPAALADRLREGLERGELSPLGPAYADDALLDASLPGGRRRVVGPRRILQALAACFPGPGRLVEWTPTVHPDGIAVWVERVDEEGHAVRQRHYLHLRDGRIVRHWVYAARPHAAPVLPVPESAEDLFGELEVAERATLASSGWSGNRLDRLVLEDGRRLIAKRIVPGSDWLGRASRDRGREALLFADGTFARLPGVIDPAVIVARRDGDAWWIVMRDVSDVLLDGASPLSREQSRFVLRAAAAMWEEFWGEETAHAGALLDRLAFASPAVADRERDEIDVLPKQLEAAWEAFGEAVDHDVAEAVLGLVVDPAPLAAALERHGSTLIHGDLRDENIGLAPGRLVLLDWGLAAQGHPAVELAWYMVHDVWRIEASHDEVVEDFRAALRERHDPAALELGIISGLVQYGWIFGHSAVVHTDPAEREWARGELAWWVPRVRRALDDWR